jgi:hypothetical protein
MKPLRHIRWWLSYHLAPTMRDRVMAGRLDKRGTMR